MEIAKWRRKYINTITHKTPEKGTEQPPGRVMVR